MPGHCFVLVLLARTHRLTCTNSLTSCLIYSPKMYLLCCTWVHGLSFEAWKHAPQRHWRSFLTSHKCQDSRSSSRSIGLWRWELQLYQCVYSQASKHFIWYERQSKEVEASSHAHQGNRKRTNQSSCHQWPYRSHLQQGERLCCCSCNRAEAAIHWWVARCSTWCYFHVSQS